MSSHSSILLREFSGFQHSLCSQNICNAAEKVKQKCKYSQSKAEYETFKIKVQMERSGLHKREGKRSGGWGTVEERRRKI
jgi:hypothetical protein